MNNVPHEGFQRVILFLKIPDAVDAVLIDSRRDERMVVKPNVSIVDESDEIFDVPGAHDPADDVVQLFRCLDLDNDRVIVDKRFR